METRIPAISMTLWEWRQVANAIDKLTPKVEGVSDTEFRLLGHFASELRRDLNLKKTE